MIRKIINRLKEFEKCELAKKVSKKILEISGLRSSVTYFLVRQGGFLQNDSRNTANLKIMTLNKNNIHDFAKIKHFRHLDPFDYLKDQDKEVYLVYRGPEAVGYACLSSKRVHKIQSLGYWKLSPEEKWLGPIYVLPQHRKFGVANYLLNQILDNEEETEKDIRFYTAINRLNIASLRLFHGYEFRIIGFTEVRKIGKTAIRKRYVTFLREMAEKFGWDIG